MFRVVVIGGIIAALGLAGAMAWSANRVKEAAEGRLYSVDDAPEMAVAMVLGARAHPGRPSAFLAARLDLALELWETGRIRAVLVSGAGTPEANHQTRVMREYLLERGLPADKVVEDPAGFDTYDSCVRARDVFGVEEMVILSQEYHLARAVAICEEIGISSFGVGEVGTRDRFPWVYGRGQVREWAANLKMEWDLFTRREPQSDPFDPALLEAAGLR